MLWAGRVAVEGVVLRRDVVKEGRGVGERGRMCC